MATKTYVYLKDELAAKLKAAAAETSKPEQEIMRDLIQYFLDAWLEAERMRLKALQEMTHQMEVKGKKR